MANDEGSKMRLTCFVPITILAIGLATHTPAIADEEVNGQESSVQETIQIENGDETRADTSALPSSEPSLLQTSYEAALNGSCADTCCGPCGQNCGAPTIFGLTLLSDRGFEGFIEPVTNPVFFEDPRSRTRLRFLFLNQMLAEDSILGGGDFQVYGMQATVALSERWTFIAQKDGYIELQPDALPNSEGWADLGTGLKYVFIRDECNQFLLSGGILYEWSQGSRDVFQGNGDGVWNFFLTTGKEFGECGNYHFVGTFGWHLPNHGGQESESLFYSLHLDRRVTDRMYLLWEMNGIHYTESGRRLPGVSVEGGDLINLGAGDVAGNHFVSMAVGTTLKLNPNVELGGAWEFPVTGREDLMDNRATVFLSLVY